MYPCINCGRRTAQRVHDLFICDACGHTWTVEDEQRMAHYLRAQGREPAEPEVVEEPELSDNGYQMADLTKPAPPETPSEHETPTASDPASEVEVKTDGAEWFEMGPDDPTQRHDLRALIADRYTVPQLVAIASHHEVTLTTERKAEVIDALIDAGVFSGRYQPTEDDSTLYMLLIDGVEVPYEGEA